MDKAIKERIDAIRQGRIPKGYIRRRYMVYPKDWGEPCSLYMVLTENKEHNKNLEYDKDDVLSVSGDCGVVNQIELLGRSFAGESVAPYHIVCTGDIVYTKSPLKKNPYGIIKRNKGRPGVVSTLYAVYHCNNQITGQYIENYFSIDSYLNNYLKPLVKRGAKNDMKVNNEDVLTGVIPFPPLAEQEKISKILDHYDKLINLCKLKVDAYKNLKKIFLSKMFPKNGSNLPELRFSEFTDAWEQRKLLSLCDKFTDGDWIEAKDQSNSGVRLIQTGNVGVAEYLDKPNNKKWVSKDTFEALHCEEVFEGDILISRLPEPAGRACIVPNIGTKMITAVDCTIVRVSENISNEFLLQYLSSQKYFDEVNTCLAGGTRQRISRSNLADFDIPVPAQKQEQQAIGHFFRHLDHLITLHQREVEEYSKLKKAMTQLLLAGIVRVNE